jgi:O-antigen ligase
MKTEQSISISLDMLERKILGVSVTLLFIWEILLFILALYLSINGSLGLHKAILTSMTIVVGIAALEYVKSWWGFYLFLLIWPITMVFQELLAKYNLWAISPAICGWQLAVALSFGWCLRSRRSSSNSCEVASMTVLRRGQQGWLLVFRLALWGLVLSYLFSALISTWRLRYPPPDWVIGEIGKGAPLTAVLFYVPSLLLGLLLLNHLSTNNFDSNGLIKNNLSSMVPSLPLIPSGKMIAFAVTGGVLAAVLFIYQITTGFTWSFNRGVPQAGTFFHYNIMASFLAIIGLLLFAVARPPKAKQVALYLLGCIFLFLTLLAQSRNGVIMILCSIMAATLIRLNWRRFLLIITVSALFLTLLLYLPMPKFEVASLDRFSQSLENFRAGGLRNTLEVRWDIYKTAILIFRDYPWFGSGPNTFLMLTAKGARFGHILGGYSMPIPGGHQVPIGHLHSMPLQLLAENGLLGMVSWSVAWFVLPLLAVTRWRSGNALALVLLVTGLGNLLDTSWMVPWMTTFYVLLIVWTCDSLLRNAFDETCISERES